MDILFFFLAKNGYSVELSHPTEIYNLIFFTFTKSRKGRCIVHIIKSYRGEGGFEVKT